jgi:hypothetical protein
VTVALQFLAEVAALLQSPVEVAVLLLFLAEVVALLSPAAEVSKLLPYLPKALFLLTLAPKTALHTLAPAEVRLLLQLSAFLRLVVLELPRLAVLLRQPDLLLQLATLLVLPQAAFPLPAEPLIHLLVEPLIHLPAEPLMYPLPAEARTHLPVKPPIHLLLEPLIRPHLK